MYEEYLLEYPNIIAKLSIKKPELKKLEKFIWYKFPKKVNSREPMFMKLKELSKIMKWKLSRGKFRPLQKMVDSNSEEDVFEYSRQAFEFLKNYDWTKSLQSLMKLKGIGIATATAILSPFSPSEIPFMYDEAMIEFSLKLTYTLKIYKELRIKLIEKADELNLSSEIEWNAELLGKAIWAKHQIDELT